jgi:hypothetical protein
MNPAVSTAQIWQRAGDLCYRSRRANCRSVSSLRYPLMIFFSKSLLATAALAGLTCVSAAIAACSPGSTNTPTPAADSSVDTPDTATDKPDTATDAASTDAAGDSSLPIQCQGGANDPVCLTCLKQQCCTLLAECLTTECKVYNECSTKCADGDATCETACTAKYPTGSALASQLRTCAGSKCAVPCK